MNEKTLNTMLEKLKQEFDISDIVEHKPRLTTFTVSKQHAETLIRELRDREAYTHLNFMTCIDYIEDGIFSLVYMLHNYGKKHSLGVHVNISRNGEEVFSIHTLWAQAWTYQRELREMYGIRFTDSPRLDEDFCLEGWDQIPPMRREFDTKKFSHERFGHREGRSSEVPREHMKVQLYPNRGGDEE
ncbi:MAG TPA: NADH-quinone oxidoreductase subunit C [Gammaproteobacteria bacterium]|nr:NADH-quinone oxidoreductase subunit C [Gammaproteobacteria bacterium]